MKMKKKYKTKWLRALRSGKYKQGQDQLKFGDRYCCLGVLEAEVCGNVSCGENGELSEDLAKEVQLDSNIQGLLTDLNDGRPTMCLFTGKLINRNKRAWRFKMIANFIEKWL